MISPPTLLRALFDRAVKVADPMRSLAQHLPDRPKGRVIVVVRDQAQVRERVLDLLPLEEAHAAVDAIRQRGVEERARHMIAIAEESLKPSMRPAKDGFERWIARGDRPM